MDEQDRPLALMLAETLEYDNFTGDEIEAAKELRRLHSESEELKKQSVFRLFLIEELKTIARRLDIENEELRRDSERYRWLKSTAGFGIRRNGVTELSVEFFEYQPDHMSQLDAAIDVAMKDK